MATDFIDKRVLGNYVVDFYCSEKELILEMDGAIHLLYGKPESDLKGKSISKS